MKVFFRAPVRSKSIHNTYYKKIYDILEKSGYHLIDKYLLESSTKQHYSKLEEGGEEDFYNETIKNLKHSDINLFDSSSPSLGIGYQIEKSLEFNKPTVVLYLQDKTPHLFAGIKDEKLILCKVSFNSLEKVLTKALIEAQHASDKRFNFFIRPSLLTYLESASKKEGITKSTFIRNLILDHMRINTS